MFQQQHDGDGLFSHKWGEGSLGYIELVAATNHLRRNTILNFGTRNVFYVFKPVKIWLIDHHKSVLFSFMNGLHFDTTVKEPDVKLFSKDVVHYLEMHYLPFVFNTKAHVANLHSPTHAIVKRDNCIRGINRSAYPNMSARHRR